MSKHRISVSIDGEKFFWIVIDRDKLIKNPTEKDLRATRSIYYNETNVCPRCREEKERDGKELTDKSILYPGNAAETDKTDKEAEGWVCKRHYSRYYERYDHNSKSNIMKSLADHRTENLNNLSLKFADDCEELTCKWKGVKNLNKENDNYRTPVDHSRNPELGVLQTKGAIFSRDIGAKGGWYIRYEIIEHEKQYDNMIIWCAGNDGGIIERGYIIPKKEIEKRQSVTIVKDPSRGVQWYEKYRITEEKEIKIINEMWQSIRLIRSP